YILDKAGALVAMDEYFTEKELSAYIPGFLEEGRFNENNELLLFPILKSTELFTANETDWEPFAQETGITPQSIKTHEDLCKAAKTYYEWTDAMTPNIKEDGKALYGRDSVANYIFIGCYQLGHEIFKVEDGVMTLDMDKDTMRTLWDNYYIPYINGYFGAYARFRSEDCKMGKILALTSSSSSVGYLPTAVTDINDTTHDISTYITRALPFEGTVTEAIVQQGASYCLLKSTPAAQEGAVEFIKWFTAYERNLDFAMMSGYSPVTIEANTAQAINSSFNQDATTPKGKNVLGALITGAEAFSECDAYATKPFNGSKEVRIILGDALEQKAAEDRRQVISLMEAGQTRQQAVSNFITDENFNTWFEELCLKVNETVK
ncbi:MAG: extracellular solute-binding protein, partial [Eubacteriaceae bacterium]|nr:extracellular solute-binding protein [Eubacteriaceae bacterium]